jgi:hypothetical protein
MDLVFDNDRLYLHNATAHYGAIPLCVSGGARGRVLGAVPNPILQLWLRNQQQQMAT